MTRSVLTAVVVLAFLQTSTEAQDAEPEGAKALGHYVGSWSTEATEILSKLAPDGGKHTARESTSWILKNRFLMGREVRQPDGVKSLWLMTYDSESKKYPFWYFNSIGIHGGEWENTWDESEKKMVSEATDTPKGWTSYGLNHFPNEKSVNVEFWMKDDAGTLLSAWEAKKSRQPDKAGEETLAKWSKTDKAEDRAPELAALESLVGTWDVTSVSKVAEWTPEEVRTTSKVTRSWVLDGSMVMDRSKSSDGKESVALLTYDPSQKAYRSWWFSSEGFTSKSTGQWDKLSESFSFESENENGFISRSIVRVIDEDLHDWRVVVTDDSGKVMFDTKWTCVRSKP